MFDNDEGGVDRDKKPKKPKKRKTGQMHKTRDKQRRTNPLFKEYLKNKNKKARSHLPTNASLEIDSDQREVPADTIGGKNNEPTSQALPSMGEPEGSRIAVYLQTKGKANYAPIINALMGGVGALSLPIACNVGMTIPFLEKLVRLVVGKVEAEPTLQVFASMLYMGDCDTTFKRAEVHRARLIEHGKKYSATISPDGVQIFSPWALTDVTAENGDRVVRSRLLVLSVGVDIAAKVEEARRKLSYLFPTGAGTEPGITARRLDNDEAGLGKALTDLVMSTMSLVQRLQIAETVAGGDGPKAGYPWAVAAMRAIEVLALLDLDDIVVAKGNLIGSVADLRKDARRCAKRNAKGQPQLIAPGEIRHVGIDVWQALGRKFRTPAIL